MLAYECRTCRTKTAQPENHKRLGHDVSDEPAGEVDWKPAQKFEYRCYTCGTRVLSRAMCLAVGHEVSSIPIPVEEPA